MERQYFIYSDIKSDAETSMKLCDERINLSQEISDLEREGFASDNKGWVIYRLQEKSEESLDFFQQALKIGKQLTNDQLMASSLNHLGAVYRKLEMYEEAMGYFIQINELDQSKVDKRTIAAVYNNRGICEWSMSKQEEALQSLGDSLKICREINNKERIVQTLRNISELSIRLGHYKKAELELLEAKEICKKTGLQNWLISINSDLKELYNKK